MSLAILDGDLYLYRYLWPAEVDIEWDPGVWTSHVDVNEVFRNFMREVESLKETLNVGEVWAAFSGTHNFRKHLYPDYKKNREKGYKRRHPVGFKAFKHEIKKALPVREESILEADDVMGILATSLSERVVLVTEDKDLRGIPGIKYNPVKDELYENDEEDARRFHLLQALTGDSVDGFGGCPGIGAKRGPKILEEKGYSWDTVLAEYEKKDVSEEEALVQARLAKILDKSHWDETKRKPILWEPQRV